MHVEKLSAEHARGGHEQRRNTQEDQRQAGARSDWLQARRPPLPVTGLQLVPFRRSLQSSRRSAPRRQLTAVALAVGLAILGWGSTSQAQTDSELRLDRNIYLPSRVLEDPGIDGELLAELEGSGAPLRVIVQPEDPFPAGAYPGRRVWLFVGQALFSFEPLGYLAGLDGVGTAYLARLQLREDPPGPDDELVPLRGLQRLLAEDKFVRGLFEAEESDGFLIRFFDGVGAVEAREILVRNGIEATMIGLPTLWVTGLESGGKIEALAGEDAVQWIDPTTPPLDLVDVVRLMSNVDLVQQLDPATGIYAGLSGKGVQVGIMDSGVDVEHNDFAGRIIRIEDDPQSHGSHVAGIAAGSGLQSDKNDDAGNPNNGSPFQWRGMAPEAEIAAFKYSGGNLLVFAEAILEHGVDVSNHSYILNGSQGLYNTNAQTLDLIVRGIPFLGLPARPAVFAAANQGHVSRQRDECENPPPGGLYPQYGSCTAFQASYFSILTPCKNCLHVGNLRKNGTMNSSSSLGPTMDGRLKPEVVAVGSSVRSVRSRNQTDSDDNPLPGNGYISKGGTSMAAPAVTGIIALMLEQYAETFGIDLDDSAPLPSTSKAILAQTAVDLEGTAGPRDNFDTGSPTQYGPGPDWASGFGLVDAQAAVQMVAEKRFLQDSVDFFNFTDTHPVSVVPGQTQLKVTLAWDDLPGTPNNNAIVPQLVNDLDLLLHSPSGQTYLPLVLPIPIPNDCDPLTPGVQVGTCFGQDDPDQDYFGPAQPGLDRRNNIEQVVVFDPGGLEPGVWTARVTFFNVEWAGYVSLTAQPYSLAGVTTARADLWIEKSDAPDPVAAGDVVVYTIEVGNDGPDDAFDVTVLDTLPAGTTFVGGASFEACLQVDAGEVRCDLGTLPAGASIAVEIAARVDADLVYQAGGPILITNQAAVSSTTPDPNLANNTAHERTRVVAVADLVILDAELFGAPTQLLIGESAEVTVRKTLGSNGPSSPMDAVLGFLAQAPGASISPPDGEIDVPALEAGEQRIVDELFTIGCTEAGWRTFTVTNSLEPKNAEDTDPDPSNNSVAVAFELECVVPIAINIKPGDPANTFPLPPGQGQGPLAAVAALTTEAGEYNAVHNIANWWLGYDLPVDFDATTIDPASVRFGKRDLVWTLTGGAPTHGAANVNDWHELGNPEKKDGIDDDMMLRFRIGETGLDFEDEEACMRGTFEQGGEHFSFFGCDFIHLVGPG
jgi:uncharacterized repeat protein (TIGR01451 family)